MLVAVRDFLRSSAFSAVAHQSPQSSQASLTATRRGPTPRLLASPRDAQRHAQVRRGS
jgi:hypothetical protein